MRILKFILLISGLIISNLIQAMETPRPTSRRGRRSIPAPVTAIQAIPVPAPTPVSSPSSPLTIANFSRASDDRTSSPARTHLPYELPDITPRSIDYSRSQAITREYAKHVMRYIRNIEEQAKNSTYTNPDTLIKLKAEAIRVSTDTLAQLNELGERAALLDRINLILNKRLKKLESDAYPATTASSKETIIGLKAVVTAVHTGFSRPISNIPSPIHK